MVASPRGPAKVHEKRPMCCIGLFSCSKQTNLLAYLGGRRSVVRNSIPRISNREPGSRTLSRIRA